MARSDLMAIKINDTPTDGWWNPLKKFLLHHIDWGFLAVGICNDVDIAGLTTG